MKEVPKISQINTDNLLRDSESSSTEECLWSYGSPKETVRYDVDPDVYVRKERSHNRHDKISSRNFRSEQDGILIYDSNARFADEEIHEKRNEDIVKSDSGYIHSGRTALTSKLKKEIKQAPIYDKEAYLKMKFYPQDPTWEHEYTLETPSSCLLRFNSKFESGNLRKAIQLSENEYNLILETDSAKSVSQ